MKIVANFYKVADVTSLRYFLFYSLFIILAVAPSFAQATLSSLNAGCATELVRFNKRSIVTERLHLRVPKPSDRAALHAMHSHREVLDQAYGPGAELTPSIMRTLLFSHPYWSLEKNLWRNLSWVIIEKETQQIVGHVEAHDRDSEAFSHLGLTEEKLAETGLPNAKAVAEIGYVVDPSQWGKGFASEAIAGVVKLLSHHIAGLTVMATTHNTNPASIRCLIKSGFTHVASRVRVCEEIPDGDELFILLMPDREAKPTTL